MDDNSIIKELFEKRTKMVSQKDNKELNNKILNFDITEKENEIIDLFSKQVDNEISNKLEDLFFYYCDVKESEKNLYNEYYYKLGFIDAVKLKEEINKNGSN